MQQLMVLLSSHCSAVPYLETPFDAVLCTCTRDGH